MKRDKITNAPIIITEDHWRNSHLSIVRYYGQIKAFGTHYEILNKDGISVLELSNPHSEHFVSGGMAIPEGEPCDLVRKDWIPVYRKLGRERTLDAVRMGLSSQGAIEHYGKAETTI